MAFPASPDSSLPQSLGEYALPQPSGKPLAFAGNTSASENRIFLHGYRVLKDQFFKCSVDSLVVSQFEFISICRATIIPITAASSPIIEIAIPNEYALGIVAAIKRQFFAQPVSAKPNSTSALPTKTGPEPLVVSNTREPIRPTRAAIDTSLINKTLLNAEYLALNWPSYTARASWARSHRPSVCTDGLCPAIRQ